MNKKLKNLQNLVAVLLFISLSIGVQQSASAVSRLPVHCSVAYSLITAYNEVVTQVCSVAL